MVKWVVRVGLQEEEDEAHDNITDVKYGLPVSPEDVEADVALSVDVRMVNGGVTVDNWSFVRILRRHSNSEVILSSTPYTVLLILQIHCQSELHDILLIDSHFNERGLIKILHILC